MQKRKFDELISHFNRKVADMSIDHKYKTELLGMISAIGVAHEKELGTNLAEVGTDCISRRAAISAICNACGKIDCDEMDKCEKLQLPPANNSEIPNSSDTISRAKAIEALRAMQTYKLFAGDDMLLIDQAGAQTELMLLPPAEPKKGKWIEDKGQQTLMQNFIERGEVWRVCSVCGAGHMIGHKYAIDKAYHDRHHNFCPNCGADMREVTT